jgi:RsiW-degrading membrane proteinase PrsW (M82 family)
VYAVTGDVGPVDLRDRIVERLSAADVAAEVDTSKAPEVSLRVDAESAADVGRLLLWRGGVTLAVVDDEVAATVTRVSGATREEVAEALSRAKAPSGHIFAIEPLATGLARSHALEWPAVAEVKTEQAVADGPRVLVPLPPETETALAALASTRGAVVIAVTRGRTVLATAPIGDLVDAHRLAIPFGASITAYTEASDVAHLLSTDELPALREVSHSAAPRDWVLASANLVLPFLVSFAWLFFVRQFDRAQPEPLWLVVATFALGALAVIPAGFLEWAWDALSPYTNPTLLTFGRSPSAFPLALVGFIVTVGVSEEGSKLLATWSLARHRREFDEPVDGIVYGAAAALGFAAAENVRYLALGRVDGPLVASRAFMSVPAHLFFGTIWGYALGRRLVHPEKKVWPMFLAAAALHGLFDTCLSIDGAGVWAFVVAFAAASLFVVHLRAALRYGPVGAGLVKDRGPRELFPMGSRGVFAAFVAVVYVFSSVLFVLALFGHDGRAGVGFGVPFGVASTLALGLLGWGARGIAASLPLDAVVDDAGVTFAGAAIAYGDVLRLERKRIPRSPGRKEQMSIVGDARRLTVGPASADTIDALSRAVEARMSQWRGGGGGAGATPASSGTRSTPSLPAANASSTSS